MTVSGLKSQFATWIRENPNSWEKEREVFSKLPLGISGPESTYLQQNFDYIHTTLVAEREYMRQIAEA